MMNSIIERWDSVDGSEVVDLGYSKKNKSKSIPVKGTMVNEIPKDFLKDNNDEYIKDLEKEFDDIWNEINKK